jgi:asparagine synthase (glutamine-hydrolysing)
VSALAGILDLRGERPSRAVLQRVLSPVRHRGAVHGEYFSDGGFALAVATFATTPEDEHTTQPVIERGRCLGFDGRIDNRDDLIRALGPARDVDEHNQVEGQSDAVESDAALALRAFSRWGDSFLQRLIGDFALALWQDDRRRLLLARDVIGQRQLLYHAGTRALVFGTEVAQILAHPDVSTSPNEAVVAEYLSCDLRSQRDTLYRDVRRLLPAHAMVVERGAVRSYRYWDIDPYAQVRHRSQRAYVEHFDEVFRTAVRAQSRTLGTLGVQLSGGLDSSSVLATAVHELDASAVCALSLVFPGLDCDESVYIDRVVDHLSVRSLRFDPASRPLDDPLDQAAAYRDVPDYPNTNMHTGLNRLMTERGCRALLNGGGGDEFWSGSFKHAADLLAAGRLWQSLALCWWDSRTPSFSYPRFGFAHMAVAPLLPKAVRAGYRWLSRPHRPVDHVLGPKLSGSVPQSAAAPPLEGATHAQRETYLELYNGWAAQGYESGARFAARCGIEERSPFTDRRLLELAFAVPESIKRQRDEPKLVMRNAMRDRLPAAVLARRTKADFDGVYNRTLEQFGQRLESPAIGRCGWVNTPALSRTYQRWQRQRRGATALWMCLAIESWYQSVLA